MGAQVPSPRRARRSTTTADAQVHHRASSPPRRARRAAITADAQMHDHGGRAGSWRLVNPRSDSAYLPTLTVELAPRSTIGFYLPTRMAGLASWLTFTFISIYAHGGARAWFKSTFILTAAAGLARIYIRRYPRAQRRRGADSYLGSHVRWRHRGATAAGVDTRLRRRRRCTITTKT